MPSSHYQSDACVTDVCRRDPVLVICCTKAALSPRTRHGRTRSSCENTADGIEIVRRGRYCPGATHMKSAVVPAAPQVWCPPFAIQNEPQMNRALVVVI